MKMALHIIAGLVGGLLACAPFVPPKRPGDGLVFIVGVFMVVLAIFD
jgi:VIT1/CCC1 family predicted Fe2+/Mn2+ transporter